MADNGSLFGAICPKLGKGAALVMPLADTAAGQAHPAESEPANAIAPRERANAAVAPGAHAIGILEPAGWHASGRLGGPGTITLLSPPPRSPEPNPVEKVGRSMRQTWLSDRVFASHDGIVAQRCEAWDTLTHQPQRILPPGPREGAHEL